MYTVRGYLYILRVQCMAILFTDLIRIRYVRIEARYN